MKTFDRSLWLYIFLAVTLGMIPNRGMASLNLGTLENSSVPAEDGKPIELKSLWQNQTAILVFLRHFG